MLRLTKRTAYVLVAFGLLLATLIVIQRKPKNSLGRDLEDEVRANLNFDNFDKTRLDDHTMILVASTTGRRFFGLSDIENFHANAKDRKEIYQVTSFKVLSKDESATSRFAAIAYEATWKITADGKTHDNKFVSREIWERRIDGWHKVFGAMDPTS